VDFVDDDALQPCENARRIWVAQQQSEAFGGGQQDMGRVRTLATTLGVGRVAGTVLDPDRQAGPLDRAAKVAADVGGQGL
jgi:hypothetical protein